MLPSCNQFVKSSHYTNASTIVHNNKLVKAVMTKWKPEYRRVGAVGFKLGMMTHYDKWGKRHPVTVLRVSIN